MMRVAAECPTCTHTTATAEPIWSGNLIIGLSVECEACGTLSVLTVPTISS